MLPILLFLANAFAQEAAPSGGNQQAATEQENPPRANLGSYFSYNDYPMEALRHGEQGRVGFRVTVNVQGAVSNCQVTQSSGSQSLDATTCRLARARLRFRPARDANGEPTTDFMDGYVNWRTADR